MSFRSFATALALAPSIWAGPAAADDAYVCDGGRMIYAMPDTLAKFKAVNVDPCSGRAIDPTRPVGPQTGARVNPPAPRAVTSSPVTPGIPKPPEPPLARTPSPRDDARAGSSPPTSGPQSIRPSTVAATRSAATPETSYRNVPIINAEPGKQAVFRHLR